MNVSYGFDLYESRSELRAVVWEMSDGRCEHPADGGRCRQEAMEMAHILPRGMGHNGYRDYPNNVMAACHRHARSTDDRSAPEWDDVPAPHDRQALSEWIREHRMSQGWAV